MKISPNTVLVMVHDGPINDSTSEYETLLENSDLTTDVWNEGISLKKQNSNFQNLFSSALNSAITLKGFDNIGYIGDNVFENLSIKSIRRNSNAEKMLVFKSVGNHAFHNCKNFVGFKSEYGSRGTWLQGIKFVNSIGDYAFAGCENWELFDKQGIYIEVDILGYSKTTFGAYAFSGCEKIDFYHKIFGIKNPITLAEGLFQKTGTTYILNSNNFPPYCYDGCSQLCVNNNGALKFVGRDITIGQGAFRDCINIKTISFPKSTTELTIGASAFEGCTNLESIEWPENLKVLTIGNDAFNNCYQLKNLNFPETLETLFIGDRAFCQYKNRSSKLSDINFPSKLKKIEIGVSAFIYCTELEVINIRAQESIIIHKYPFQSCDKLLGFVAISQGDLQIEEEGISYYPLNLTLLLLRGEKMSIGDNLGVNPNTLITLGADFVTTKNICGSMNRDNNKLKNLYLYQKVNYGNTVKQSEGLKNLSKLTNIYLAEGLVLKLGPDALKNCTSLRKITTLDDTTVIAADQFYINPSLQIEFGSLCFNNVLTNKTTNITSITFPKLNGVPNGSNLLNYCFGHLKINSAKGLTFNLYDTKIPKNCFNGSNIETLKVSKDLSEIQDGAFKDCTLLNAIEPIGANTFNSLSYIGEDCFNNTALRVKDTTNKHWYAMVGDKRVYIDSIEGGNNTIVSPECDLVAKAAVRPEVTDITCAFVGNKRVHKEAFTESKLLFIFKNNIYNLKNLTLKTKEGETIKLYSSSLHPALQNLRNATKLLILSPIETFGVCPFSQNIKIETLEFGTSSKPINVPNNFCDRKITIQNLILNSNVVGASSFVGLTSPLSNLKINMNSSLKLSHQAFYSDNLIIRTLNFNKEIEDWMKSVIIEDKNSSPIPYVLRFVTPEHPDGVFRIAPTAKTTPEPYVLLNNKFINEIDFTNLEVTTNNSNSLQGEALIHIYGPISTARTLIGNVDYLKLDNTPTGKIYTNEQWGDIK